MNDWVPIGEGKYLVEKAYLVTPDDTAVALEEAIIDVYTGAGGNAGCGEAVRCRTCSSWPSMKITTNWTF